MQRYWLKLKKWWTDTTFTPFYRTATLYRHIPAETEDFHLRNVRIFRVTGAHVRCTFNPLRPATWFVTRTRAIQIAREASKISHYLQVYGGSPRRPHTLFS